MPPLRLFLAFLLLVPAQTAFAQESFLSIQNGISHIDITGDGKPETLIKAWRENFNAHGFYTIQFLQNEKNNNLSVIGVESPLENQEIYSFLQTEGGSDCITKDYRILQKGIASFLIQAIRPLQGVSYSEKEKLNYYRPEAGRFVGRG
jgi:hypothetical protein